MQLLLDTQVFLWSAVSPYYLSEEAYRAIADPRNQIFVSAAVAWELVLKYPKGRVELPMLPDVYVSSRIAAMGFLPLAISVEHAQAVRAVPAVHRDPFDRIMIAQATVDGLTFVIRGADALTYPVLTIHA